MIWSVSAQTLKATGAVPTGRCANRSIAHSFFCLKKGCSLTLFVWEERGLVTASANGTTDSPDAYVWSTSEQARLRATSLYLIRSIVEKYGGTVDIDLSSDTLSIDVPEGKKVDCAREIDEQVGAMCG